ncbi:MAG TPA: SGNH/GDSL hydrolase family protein, partial [Candidatus Saccharimonadales bacterium]
MSRLPTPGSDNGNWGDILNDYLSQSHSADGSLKAGAVGASQIQDGALPKTKLDATTQASLTKADGSLQAANHLSEVTPATARANLGLGSAATMSPAQLANDAALVAMYAPRTDRMARAAAVAATMNRTVMASPPTVTTSTTTDVTLTRQYLITSSTAQFAFRGGAPVVFSATFLRFPVVTLLAGSGNVGGTGAGGAQQNANGWAVEFMADATTVQIHVRNVSGSGAMVEVDGQPVSASLIAYPATDGNVGFIKLAFGSRAVRRIRLEAAQNGGFAGVSVGPTETIWKPTDSGGRLVIAGDSITAQTGAVLPNGGMAIEAAKNLGFSDCWEVGISGTGWINAGSYGSTIACTQRIADVVAANPDLLILPTSSNDTAGSPLTTAMLAGFQAYRSALPKVPIIVMGVPTRTATVDRETAAKAAFDAWADGNSWWIPTYSDPSGRWIDGTGTT